MVWRLGESVILMAMRTRSPRPEPWSCAHITHPEQRPRAQQWLELRLHRLLEVVLNHFVQNLLVTLMENHQVAMRSLQVEVLRAVPVSSSMLTTASTAVMIELTYVELDYQ